MSNLTTQEAETIARLATKAREEGVKLYRARRDGRHYATSATTPGKLYFVTLASCTCPGFISHQRCKHWAALTLAVLNDPEGGEPETCHACNGTGKVEELRSRWVGGSKLGYRSTWMVDVPCTACADVDAMTIAA